MLQKFIRVLVATTATMNHVDAMGDSYPVKPVRIVTAEAGGGVDFAARAIATGLTGVMGKQFVVDNRGGTVIIPAEAVAKATPDGYTLLVYSNNFWILPLLQDGVPYEPLRDFAPVTPITSTPNLLVVHPSLPVHSVKELIAVAKAKPGTINYGSGPAGASNHLAGELFKYMAGVNIVRVAYKGSGPALVALLGGEIQMMIGQASMVTSAVKADKLRVLAITTLHPSPLFPDLPTLAASGLPGYEIASVNGIFAPIKTPRNVVQELNRAAAKAFDAETKNRLTSVGSEPATGPTPEQFTNYVKADIERMGKVIKSAGKRGE